MSDIINFRERKLSKEPVTWSVHFTHDAEGFLLTVEGIGQDYESKKLMIEWLREAALSIEESLFEEIK